MEDGSKDLMLELENAINESLVNSERIAAAIGEIKRAGYDIFLIVEATIGFKKHGEAEEDGVADQRAASLKTPPPFEPQEKIRWTNQDHKFLRALKISPEDDEADSK